MNLSLYIHVRTGLLLQSSKVNSQVSLPALFRQDSVALRLQFVDDNPSGGYTAPLQIVPVDALSIRVGIGDPGTPLALQATWTRDTVNDWFTGQLDLNTTELEAAFGGGNPTLKKIFEVELVDSGTQRQTYQYAVTIKPDVIRSGAPDPEEYTPPGALADNLALILTDSDSIFWTRTGDTFAPGIEVAHGRRTIFPAASQAAMLALPAQKGDLCVRTDITRCYELRGLYSEPTLTFESVNPASLDSWFLLPVNFYNRGEWAADQTYGRWEVVQRKGATFLSLVANNLNFDPAQVKMDADLDYADYLGTKWVVLAMSHSHQATTSAIAGGIDVFVFYMPKWSKYHLAQRTWVHGTAPGYELLFAYVISDEDAKEGDVLEILLDLTQAPGRAKDTSIRFYNESHPEEAPLKNFSGFEQDHIHFRVKFLRAADTWVLLDWTHYVREHSASTLAITEAGTSIITLPAGSLRHLVEVALTEPGSASEYTAKLVLDIAGPAVQPGRVIGLLIALPATGVTVEVRNATSTGTTLLSFASDGGAETVYVEAQFNGTAWKLLYPDAHVVGAGTGGSPPATEDDLESLGNITGTVNLDLSSTPYAQATATGNLTLGITNGAGVGKHRSKTLYLAAPAADRSLTLAAGFVALVTLPVTQPTGKAAVVTLTDRNGSKTGTIALQP